MTTTSSARMSHFRPYCSDGVKRKLLEATGLPPEEALRKLLLEEPTLAAISRRTGINRTQIYQSLACFGIEPVAYDHSSFMQRWYTEHPPEFRQRITEAAHKASKGRPKTHDHLVKIAIAKQYRPLSKGEQAVSDLLCASGIQHTVQLAIDIYNIDVAVPEAHLAIEVNGGNWHTASSHDSDDRKRLFLEAQGWRVAYLWGTLDEIRAHAVSLIATLPLAHDHQP
jgi:very-short-patch-repair endonuclease